MCRPEVADPDGSGLYCVGMTQVRDLAERRTFGRGLLLALLANLAIALAAIPVANHWNGHGGEEWAVGLVAGSAVITGVVGAATLALTPLRGWGVGLLTGAVLAPLLVGATFIWYFAILNGS